MGERARPSLDGPLNQDMSNSARVSSRFEAELTRIEGLRSEHESVTAQAIKESINQMLDLSGQRASWRYHFMIHQLVSNTATALAATDARKQGGMDAVKREQAGQ